MTKLKSVNPSTLELLGEVDVSSAKEIRDKVRQAKQAKQGWYQIGVKGRIKYLRRVVELFTKRQEEFAKLIANEMGMPLTQSRYDVSGAVEFLEWYLDNAEKYLAPEVVHKDTKQIHTVHRVPVGVVAAITPWNFPASNFVWMCGQNLAVGNTIVFKASEEVPLCGKLIEEVFVAAKLPTGVFSEVYGAGDVGEMLANEDIDMICFTGSTAVGQKLYRVAADKFIRVFLELGGSAPGIVFKDADIDIAIEKIYANRYDNCGQICDGLKRLIVHESRYEEVIEKLAAKLQSTTVGNAIDESTDIGPLVSDKQLRFLQKQVKDAKSKGAKVEYQYDLPNGLKGHFYPPTILSNISYDMLVWKEEVFGPVLPVVKFKTEEEALKLANDTKYGLGGYVFTDDKKLAERFALNLESGMIQMNATSCITPSSPFGGTKMSGIGREHGKFGFYDLTDVKLISLEK